MNIVHRFRDWVLTPLGNRERGTTKGWTTSDPEMERMLNRLCPGQMPEIVWAWEGWTQSIHRVGILLRLTMPVIAVMTISLVLGIALDNNPLRVMAWLSILVLLIMMVVVHLMMRRGDEHRDRYLSWDTVCRQGKGGTQG
jgi:hypothetical protein